MVSTASMVIEFLTPDTLRLVQWPVIMTVLDTPLTRDDVVAAGDGPILADAGDGEAAARRWGG